MTKLPTILTIAALSALPFAAGTVSADDTPPVCAAGYVAAGPYCVNPIYVDNPLFVDPATCEHGYYQGACLADTLPDPVVLDEAAYTFQTPPAPVAQTAPVHAVEAIVAPVVALWLTPAELHLGDLRAAR